MDPLHWGAIGWGDVCERKSGPPLYEVEGCRLLGITRRDAAAGADAARRHQTTYYPTVEALLAVPEIEAVYVATPDAYHCEGTLAAAEAGKHVLVEKAMALNAAECTRMIETCARHGVTLGVAYYRRCYPMIRRAKALLDEGAIGALEAIYLNDEFPLSHRLDLVHFFAGDLATVGSATEDLRPGSHAPRGAVLHCMSTSGVEATTPAGWEEKLLPEVVELTGERGRILVQDLKAGRLRTEIDGQVREEDLGAPPWMHWGLMENFYHALRGKAPLACDGVEGRKSTVILDIVATLAADNAPIPVDYGG